MVQTNGGRWAGGGGVVVLLVVIAVVNASLVSSQKQRNLVFLLLLYHRKRQSERGRTREGATEERAPPLVFSKSYNENVERENMKYST